MNLKTERLSIRPFNKEDEEFLLELYTDPETCKYLLHDVWTEENQRGNLDRKLTQNRLTKDTSVSLAVVLEDEVIGDLSAWYTEVRDTVEIGYVFSKKYTGKGYATEAISALIKYLFEEYRLHRIQANLDARNTSSYKLCKRVGMRLEAHFIQDYWSKGEWTDSYVFGILASET